MTIRRTAGSAMAPPPVTGTAGETTRQRGIESLVAEFALHAQRRARVGHQIALIDHQRAAACAAFNTIEARLAWLARGMDALDPQLRGPMPSPAALPEPPPRHAPEPAYQQAAVGFSAGPPGLGRASEARQPAPPAAAPLAHAPDAHAKVAYSPPRLSARPPRLPRPAAARWKR